MYEMKNEGYIIQRVREGGKCVAIASVNALLNRVNTLGRGIVI